MEEIHTYPVRWYILITYALNSFLQSLELLLYQSVPEVVYECYSEAHVDSSILNLVISFGALATILSTPLLIFVDAYLNNIKALTLICNTFLTIQNIFRMIPHWITSAMPHAVVFMVLTQVFNNLGASFSYTLPSRVSSAWFPPEERVLTTAICAFVNPFGAALTFLIVPVIIRDADDYVVILYVILILHFLLALLILIYFPSKPPIPPSYSELGREKALEQQAQEILDSLNISSPESPDGNTPMKQTSAVSRLPKSIRAKRALEPVKTMFRYFAHPYILLLMLQATFHYGTLQAWGFNIPILFLGANIRGKFGSYVTFAHLMLNAFGIFLEGTITQKLKKQEKRILQIVCTVNLILAAILIPTFGLGRVTGSTWEEGTDPNAASDTYNVPWRINKWVLAIIVSIQGLFAGAPFSTFFDTAAEMAYPTSDTVTGGLVILFISFGMFTVPLLYGYIGIGWTNVIATALLLFAFILYIPLRIDYRRTVAEEEGKKRAEGVEMQNTSEESKSTSSTPAQTLDNDNNSDTNNDAGTEDERERERGESDGTPEGGEDSKETQQYHHSDGDENDTVADESMRENDEDAQTRETDDNSTPTVSVEGHSID